MKFTASAKIATALAGTLMFGLTSCATVTAQAGALPGKTMSAYPTDTPSPVATSAPLPYKMQDGTTVMIDRSAPLPDAVKQDVITKMAPAMAENKTGYTSAGPTHDAIVKAGGEVGKTFVVVQQLLGYDRNGNGPSLFWAVSSPTNCDPTASKDEAVACAEVFINADDTRYTLLVFN